MALRCKAQLTRPCCISNPAWLRELTKPWDAVEGLGAGGKGVFRRLSSTGRQKPTWIFAQSTSEVDQSTSMERRYNASSPRRLHAILGRRTSDTGSWVHIA